jgi:signal transduction histidine kinase
VKNLTARLVLLLMLVLLVVTGLADYVRLARERDRLVAVTMTDQRIFTDTLALAVRRNVSRGRTTEELQELLEDIRRRPGLAWAAIYDPKGRRVAAAAGSGEAPAQADHLVERALASRAPVSETFMEPGGKVLRSIRPLRWPDGGTAAVEVRQSLRGVEREFERAVRESVVTRVAVLALFVLLVFVVTRWSVARPIRALIRGARAVGSGDLTQRIDMRGTTELRQLADEFNRMAESLERAQRALVAQSEERVRLEREVEQAQKLAAVGLLAAEVAHELGTPLNVISGRTEALSRSLPPDAPGRRHVELIQAQTDRIAHIVRDLLDHARPRRPDLRLQALGPLLARVVDLVDARFRGKGVRLALEPAPPEAVVHADPDQLYQVFINLLSNALDAAAPGTVVRIASGPEPLLPAAGRHGVIRGKVDPPFAAVHVMDEGPGLSHDEMSRVFQPFFSTKRRGQGTGLGLPIVEEIVRAHRGEVEILSTPGAGTEVVVRLPLGIRREPGAAVPARADARPSASHPGGTIEARSA